MKVSIITPARNSAKTIADCVKSVNNQSYQDIEHIVVDAASTDNTPEVARCVPNRITHLLSEPDKGMYDGINKGIRIASGELVGVLNSDDVFYSSESVQTIVDAIKTKQVDAVFGNLIFTNEKGRIVRYWKSHPFTPGSFAKSWTPAHPTFYCKRFLYEKLGCYKTNYIIASDTELMFRFLELHKVSSYFIDELLVKMQAGGVSNRGLKSTLIITREMKRAFRENNLSLNMFKYLFYKGLKVKELFKRF